MKLSKHLIYYWTLIYFLLLAFFQVNAQKVKIDHNPEAPESLLDSLFLEYNNLDRPGVVISVIYNGDIQYQKAYGSANLEYAIPNTTSTIFHVASLAKQFTAFSILLLQESEKLSLEDDIRKYIPEVPDFGHTITLRHLLTHTSGLRDQWNLFLIQGVRSEDVITNKHVLDLIKEQKELNFIPGNEYFYSNTGYSLLAELITRVTGQSFADFTWENIFSPLQMNNTFFNDDFEKVIQNRTYSYYSRDGESYSKRVLNKGNVGPTNLLTTVEDLSLWMMNFESPEPIVGSPEIFNQMTTEAVLNNGHTFGGGLGFFMNNMRGITEVEHGGADAGFRAHLSMFPAYKFGVAALSNNAHSDVRMIASKVIDLYLSDFYKESNIASVEQKRNFIMLDPKGLEPFVGHYWTKEHAYTRYIYLKNDTLMHIRTENNECPLAPIGENEFKVMNVPVDALVRFENIGGETTLIETVNAGQPILLEKYAPVDYALDDWLKYEGVYYSDELRTVYEIVWFNDKLIAQHMRMGSIELKMIKHNFFTGSRGFFGNVEFLRDDAENVTGFKVSNGRVRNLLFEKQKTSENKRD